MTDRQAHTLWHQLLAAIARGDRAAEIMLVARCAKAGIRRVPCR